MKKVLLLCVSPVKGDIKRNLYSFQNESGDTQVVEGFMTNEAPTKSVIMQVDRLDEIIMICSKTVGDKIEVTSNESPIEFPETCTHVEFYTKQITQFAESYDVRYKEKPIEYKEVWISDVAETEELSAAVIKVAEDVADLGEDVQLFLEFNGGQRYIAFLLATIANMMKYRGVDVRQVMTMNFETLAKNKEAAIPIQNMAPIFRSFDLISGIDEYVNYGRVKGLKAYFDKAQNKEIEKILLRMEKFANNLQLCKTSYVMQKRKELQGLLKNYQDTKKNEQKLSAYERMFLYVVNDILEGYKGIFEGDLPSVIKWCLEKDFIQQALTFCSEEMPDYFWRMGIYAPSEVEKNEYAYLIEQIRKGKVREAKSFFSNGMSKSSSKYAYNWLIKYVDKVETDKAYENFVKNASKEYREILCNNPYWKPRKEEKIEFKHFNMSNMSKDSKGMANANDKAGRLLHFISKGRVVSICQDERVLKEVIMVYFLLKDQRNNTNHASDGQKDESAWSYEIICRVLKNFVCKLEEMEK